MPERDWRHALEDIRAALDGIQQATSGKSLADYVENWMLKHAVQRASRALPDDIKASRPEVPWHKVKAIGNVLRHAYHGLSDKIMWGVVEDELPRLRTAVEAIQAEAE